MQSQSNPIGALKEAIDREGLNYCLAVHKQFVEVGPPHLPRFTCTLTYGQHAVQSAEHAQKKMAEHDAAERLLVAMQQAEKAATEAKAAAAKKAADEKAASGKAARPYYDNTDHAAEPVRLQWLNRHGDASIRWVFLRCCAQIGTEGADGVVRSQLRCDNAVPVDARGHGGKLLLHLRNSSRTQARLKRDGVEGTWRTGAAVALELCQHGRQRGTVLGRSRCDAWLSISVQQASTHLWNAP